MVTSNASYSAWKGSYSPAVVKACRGSVARKTRRIGATSLAEIVPFSSPVTMSDTGPPPLPKLLLMLFWLKRIDDGLTVPLSARSPSAVFAATLPDRCSSTGCAQESALRVHGGQIRRPPERTSRRAAPQRAPGRGF